MGTLLKAENSTLKGWKNSHKSIHLFERVQKIVFMKDFETALFEKLGVDRVLHPKREMYLHSDTAGYTKDSMHLDPGEECYFLLMLAVLVPLWFALQIIGSQKRNI